MSKRGESAQKSKQALGRQRAGLKRRAGRKGRFGAAPKEQRAAEAPRAGSMPSSTVLERAHDREFAKMNERRKPKQVKSAGLERQPRYLSDTARGIFRRVARYAMAPLSLARAVVDRFRAHES